MRRIYQFTLYADLDGEADPELVAGALMAAIPVRLLPEVRLLGLDAIYRGRRLAVRRARDAGRRYSVARRSLPG